MIGIEYAGSGLASNIFAIAFMIGWLSLNARRLQDRGHTGWWQLAYLVPIIPIIYFMFLFLVAQNAAYGIALVLSVILLIGILITLIVVCCLPPKEDENKWGRNPLLIDSALTDQITD